MMGSGTPVILGLTGGGMTTGPRRLIVAGNPATATYRRPSVALGFDAAGALFAASSDTPRLVGPEPRLLIEREGANLIPNPRFVGGMPGIIGSGGVAPTDWNLTAHAAMAREIMGLGEEEGIPFLDIRLFGTQPNTTAAVLTSWQSGSWPCSQGDQFTLSLCVRVVGGSVSGLSAFRLRVQERNGTSNTTGSNRLTFAPTTAPLQAQRRSAQHATTGAMTNNALLQLHMIPLANAPIDCTLRIALPQVERGGGVTSPILPPVGIPGVSWRAAGMLLDEPAGGLPAEGTLLLDARLPASPGTIRRLVAVETAAGGEGIAIVTNGAGTSLSGQAFPTGGTTAGRTITAQSRFRAALAWHAGGSAVSVNGALPVSGAAPPPGLVRIVHGGNAAAEALEIGSLELLPQRLPDSALSSLTSLV